MSRLDFSPKQEEPWTYNASKNPKRKKKNGLLYFNIDIKMRDESEEEALDKCTACRLSSIMPKWCWSKVYDIIVFGFSIFFPNINAVGIFFKHFIKLNVA